MDNVTKKFLDYISFATTSDHDSKTFPSTASQIEFGKYLVSECKKIGLSDAMADEYGYVTATLPSNCDEKIPVVGFISHLDTSSDANGTSIKPRIIENYDGKDILLGNNVVLSPKEFPSLLNYVGESLITTSGDTLLSADDKAGVAEILTAMEVLVNSPTIKHGEVRISFTPDEEVGRGANHFDVKKFGAAFAYTIDGGEVGSLEAESFNAARAKFHIIGRSVHPGYAKDTMVNAGLIANEICNMFPKDETPATTSGKEGFYHLVSFSGSVEEAHLNFIVRDFDATEFGVRKQFVQNIAENINTKYGQGTVTIEVYDEYYNMLEKVKPHQYIIDIAAKAMEQCGVKPSFQSIRGGTDGSRLSYMGLPCPNIFTGGHNFHGPFEYIPIFAMNKAVDVIVNIASLVYENFKK